MSSTKELETAGEKAQRSSQDAPGPALALSGSFHAPEPDDDYQSVMDSASQTGSMLSSLQPSRLSVTSSLRDARPQGSAR